MFTFTSIGLVWSALAVGVGLCGWWLVPAAVLGGLAADQLLHGDAED